MRSTLKTVALLALLAAAFGVPRSEAQIIGGYGVKVGALSAGAFDSTSDGVDRRADFQALVSAGRLRVPFFSVVTEAGYVQRGFTETVDVREGPDGPLARTVEARTRLDYEMRTRLDYEARFDFDLTDSLGDAPRDLRNNAFVVGVAL